MPTVTLPNTFGSPDAELNATYFNDNFYDPVNANTSFETMNGRLDEDNMDATGWTAVTAEQVQPGALVGAGYVAGTANLDYFKSWFLDVDTSSSTSVTDRYLPIPGGNEAFYLPYSCMVVFTWQICWVNQSDTEGEASRIRLFVDGSPISVERRIVNRCVTSGTGSTWFGPGDDNHEGRAKSRYWSGHYVCELTSGWHTAGLRIVADADIRQTRVWARSFKRIHFAKEPSWGDHN